MANRKGKSKAKEVDSDDEFDEVDPKTVAALTRALIPAVNAAVAKAIKQEIKDLKLQEKLRSIEEALQTVTNLGERIEATEKSLEFTASRLEKLVSVTLPKMNAHIAQVSESVAMENLELHVHRRKWNLIIHGVSGEAGEDPSTTRREILAFAENKLKVKKAAPMMACHRLSQTKDAGIIVRFVDLADRDAWLAGTKHLRSTANGAKYSISPDLPPKLRPLKDEIMKKRKELEPSRKKQATVRYLPSWPFVQLSFKDRKDNKIVPSVSKSKVLGDILGIKPLFPFKEEN